jgi:peptidoglycan/LPS O-acetylase OafA/YrhL
MAGFFGALLLERKGPAEFMQNRGKRILLPLLASLALGIPLLKALQLVQRLLAATGGVRAQDFLAWYPRMLSDFNAGPYWFLLILVQFYVLALLLRPLGRLLPVGKAADTVRKGVDRLFTSAWSPSVLALLSMAGLATVPAGVFPAPQGFVPELRILGVYGPFLLFGWLLYHRRHLLQGFVRGAWRHLGLGLLWMAATLAAVAVQLGNPAWKTAAFAATVVAGSLCVWELLFALLGLFQRYIGTEHRVLKYLSDSSYWLYLAHSPVLLLLQLLVFRTSWPGSLKLAVTLALAVPILLASYHWAVRSTWIGAWLNGRRHPRRTVTERGLDGLLPRAASLNP